jgi:hypothetical protein
LETNKRKRRATMLSEEQKSEDPTPVAPAEGPRGVVDEETAVPASLTSPEAPADFDVDVDVGVVEKAGAYAATELEGSSEEIKEEGKDEMKKTHMKVAADAPWKDRMWEVFSTFWPLGLVAFGGPQVSFHIHIHIHIHIRDLFIIADNTISLYI